MIELVEEKTSRLTNRHGLPEAFVRAVQSHTHKGADISATGLKLSPRQFWLGKRHGHEVVEDVVDRMWALWGTTFHAIMERGDDTETLHKEKYIETQIGGVKLSGTIDRVTKDHEIEDWKTTSAFSVAFGSNIEGWTLQLNVYAYLLKVGQGIDAKALNIWAMMRDWRTSEVETVRGYPDAPVKKITLDLWPLEKTKAVIEERIALIFSNKDTADDDLPKCTKDDVWFNEKKGVPNKCGKYCNGRDFCNQYQGFLNKV